MVEPVENQSILSQLLASQLRAQQQEISPDESVTNRFTGMTVQGKDSELRAVFQASARAQEDGTPKVYSMSLAEIETEITRCETKIEERPLVSRIEILNLPHLQAAQAKLTL